MKQHHKLTVALCLIWAATLLYGEMFAFWIPSLFSCSWPHHHHQMEDHKGEFKKIAVIADPQLMDRTSLSLPPKSLALEVAQFYTDLNMRRSYLASIAPFKPDMILFLGDYFDGGPFLSDEEWQESFNRFKHIFGLNKRERFTDTPVHYIPGNHDIGYSLIHSRKPEIVRRYEAGFGIRNYRFTVGKVEFIAVDAQTLDGNPKEILTSSTWEFVKNVSKDNQSYPRVLLTHIPLYRPDRTPCGPHRGSSVINQRIWRASQDRDIMYQNYITKESSNKLLDLIKPVLVLSGHDHDQCTITHESKNGPANEHTIGTISWQQGNFYPSFLLLSVSDSVFANASTSTLTQLCFLPTQLYIYIWYLSQFLLTLVVIIFWPKNGISFSPHLSDFVKNIFRGGGTKEKNEDENCEYEMIWDAEGSMHLVKKATVTPLKRPTDKGTVERGNAVIRPTARKNVSEEGEICMDVDKNTDAGVKLPSRTMRSRTKLVIQRLVRTFGILLVIAVVNVPIYVMLLFKDWIDQ